MEVFFAFLVLGCAFLLSFLNSTGSGAREAHKQLGAAPPSLPPAAKSAAGLTKPQPGLQVDRQRKEQVIKTIEDSPEEVVQTLKQWLQE